jgi:hypothetical protein
MSDQLGFIEQINKLQQDCGLPDHAAAFILGCIFVRLCRLNGSDPAARFRDVLLTEPEHLRSPPQAEVKSPPESP